MARKKEQPKFTYRFFVNGEERMPTPEEVAKMNDIALRAAGYRPHEEVEEIMKMREEVRR